MSDAIFKEGFGPSKLLREPIIPIVYPKPGCPCEVILLGNKVFRAEVHFDRDAGPKGRSRPCLGAPLCKFCPNMGSHEVTYLAACLPGSLCLCVLHLSEGGKEDAEAILAGLAIWRETILFAIRADRRREARMKVSSKGRTIEGPLPGMFDVRRTVERSWGMIGGARTDTRSRSPRPSTSHTNGRS